MSLITKAHGLNNSFWNWRFIPHDDIKISPDFSRQSVIGSQCFGICKWDDFHIRHMRWLRETFNFKPSLAVNYRSPAVLRTYSILHLLGCSSYQIHRLSVPHISLSLSPWGQLDSPWPLNLQTQLTHLHLHQEKPSNKLLWTSRWTCWSDFSQ